MILTKASPQNATKCHWALDATQEKSLDGCTEVMLLFFQGWVAPQKTTAQKWQTLMTQCFSLSWKSSQDSQQSILVTDSALHNTSHPCQQLQQHTQSNRSPPHSDPHSSNKFHFQLNSATFNFYLWSSVTRGHRELQEVPAINRISSDSPHLSNLKCFPCTTVQTYWH